MSGLRLTSVGLTHLCAIGSDGQIGLREPATAARLSVSLLANVAGQSHFFWPLLRFPSVAPDES